MGRLSNDGFLTALDKQFNKVRATGSLFITFKRYCPTPSKKGKPNPEGADPLCLIRAKLGSNCISTVVPQRDVPRFQVDASPAKSPAGACCVPSDPPFIILFANSQPGALHPPQSAFATILKGNMDALRKPEKEKKDRKKKGANPHEHL
jgi:hypothetical protein